MTTYLGFKFRDSNNKKRKQHNHNTVHIAGRGSVVCQLRIPVSQFSPTGRERLTKMKMK
jgi:hypothetical protein